MTEAVLRKIIEAVEKVKANGHGQVVIVVVKGKIVRIDKIEQEQITE